MTSDDYQIHNIYRYSRKSYKSRRNCTQDCTLDNSREDETLNPVEPAREDVELVEHSPRSDDYELITPGCLYDLDTQHDLTNILHKKCPVITLAQQQLLRVLDETNHILARVPGENCSALIRCLSYCKEVTLYHNKAIYVLVAVVCGVFLSGLLLGAATCGTHFGKFNNPILNCIDNYFIPDSISIEDSFRCIT